MLVASDHTHVEWYTRRPDGWLLSSATGPESSVELQSLECRLPLRHLYAKVESA